jgi:hypothetical protein
MSEPIPVESITYAEHFRLWLSVVLGPVVTFFGFLFVWRQLAISARQARVASNSYRLAVKSAGRAAAESANQQVWKKAEFLANQVRDFYADKVIERAIHMLDWQACKIRFHENQPPVLCMHDPTARYSPIHEASPHIDVAGAGNAVFLVDALRIHRDDKDFTDAESDIRSTFDWFLFRLGQFQHMIDSGLFSYEEVDIHLSYDLDLLSDGLGPGHVSLALTPCINAYIDKYRFAAAKRLIASRVELRPKAVGSSA